MTESPPTAPTPPTPPTPPAGTDPGASSQPAAGAAPDLQSAGAAGRSKPGSPPPPDTNQARSEPVSDSDAPEDPDTLDTTASMTSANPQAPSAARIAAEPVIARQGRQDAGAGQAQGVAVPHTAPAPGTSQETTGVGEVGSATPVEPGHQAGGTGSQPVVGAHRAQAPDGEVGPS